MARVIEKTVFQFDELDECAKERARDWFRQSGDTWAWEGEWIASVQAFDRIAPIKIRGWDIDHGHVSIEWVGPDYANRYDHGEAIGELSGIRAWKWLQNNDWFAWAARNKAGECTMTGYCGDCPFGDAIAAYAAKPLSVPALEQVFYEAAQAWVYEARADMEYSYSDEAIDENIRINEYEFYENGRIF